MKRFDRIQLAELPGLVMNRICSASFWTAVAKRSDDTALRALPKRRGASLPAAVQDAAALLSRRSPLALFPPVEFPISAYR